jgi:hypothetical protein
MVFGIGLRMTVLSDTENGFFLTKKKISETHEKRTARTTGIVPSGV